jgi:hypothetical protein
MSEKEMSGGMNCPYINPLHNFQRVLRETCRTLDKILNTEWSGEMVDK